MEVVGLCAVCHAPGPLVGCPVCGAQIHARHLEPGGGHIHMRHGPGAPPKEWEHYKR